MNEQRFLNLIVVAFGVINLIVSVVNVQVSKWNQEYLFAHQNEMRVGHSVTLPDSSIVTNYSYLPTPFSAASSTLNFVSLIIMPILVVLVSIFYASRLLLAKSSLFKGLFPYGIYLLSEVYSFFFELRQTYPGEDVREFLYMFAIFRFGLLLLIVITANAIVYFIRKRKEGLTRT